MKFFWIVVPEPGRVHLIQAENEAMAGVEAFKRFGILLREAQ